MCLSVWFDIFPFMSRPIQDVSLERRTLSNSALFTELSKHVCHQLHVTSIWHRLDQVASTVGKHRRKSHLDVTVWPNIALIRSIKAELFLSSIILLFSNI